MSWKKQSLRVFALSVFAAPATLFAAEPRVIVPSPRPPQVVIETDNSTYDVLNKFRNARSSEQIHFQAIETLFPPTPERASVRRGYTMVRELVDAKKAASEAAARLEEERAKLEAARVELESQAKDKWEIESDEFDYYEFDNSDVEPQPEFEPQPEPKPKKAGPKPAARSTHKPHRHHHRHHQHHHAQQSPQRDARTAPHIPVRRGILARFFQK